MIGVPFSVSYEGIIKALGVNWAMSLRLMTSVPEDQADAALYRQVLLSCLKNGEMMQALRPEIRRLNRFNPCFLVGGSN